MSNLKVLTVAKFDNLQAYWASNFKSCWQAPPKTLGRGLTTHSDKRLKSGRTGRGPKCFTSRSDYGRGRTGWFGGHQHGGTGRAPKCVTLSDKFMSAFTVVAPRSVVRLSFACGLRPHAKLNSRTPPAPFKRSNGTLKTC